MTNNRLGDVIAQIARDHGEQVLANTQLMIAIFMDVAPHMQRERELLRAFLLSDGTNKLLSVVGSTAVKQKTAMDRLVKVLHDEHSIEEDVARYVCAEFYYSLTGNTWQFGIPKTEPKAKSVVKPKPTSHKYHYLDIHTDVNIKKMKTYADRNVLVEVDGRNVYILLPESPEFGKPIKYPGLGRVDSKTGNRGDLYVTVQRQDSRHVLHRTSVVIALIAILVLLGIAILLMVTSGNGFANSQANDSRLFIR